MDQLPHAPCGLDYFSKARIKGTSMPKKSKPPSLLKKLEALNRKSDPYAELYLGEGTRKEQSTAISPPKRKPNAILSAKPREPKYDVLSSLATIAHGSIAICLVMLIPTIVIAMISNLIQIGNHLTIYEVLSVIVFIAALSGGLLVVFASVRK